MSEESGGRAGANRDAKGRFGAGNGGRPPGVKDRRALLKEEFLRWWIDGDGTESELPEAQRLKPLRERWRTLAQSSDENIRARVETYMADQAWGKAKESVDVFHHGEVVEGAEQEMAEFWHDRGPIPGAFIPQEIEGVQ